MRIDYGLGHGNFCVKHRTQGEYALMPETVPISKFKATCLALLAQVKRTGQPILVTRRGEPIAQILPPPAQPGSWLGTFQATGKIVGDIIAPAVEEQEWGVGRS